MACGGVALAAVAGSVAAWAPSADASAVAHVETLPSSLAAFSLLGLRSRGPAAAPGTGLRGGAVTGPAPVEEFSRPGAEAAAAADSSRGSWFAAAAAAVAACCLAFASLAPQPALAVPAGQRVNRDPVSLLQYALPLEEVFGAKKVETVRSIQRDIEEAREKLKLRLWSQGQSVAEDALSKTTKRKDDLLKPVDASRKAAAGAVVTKLSEEFPKMITAFQEGANVAAMTTADKETADAALKSIETSQQLLGDLEELMLPPGYKSPIPKEKWLSAYDNVPRLQGRARVQMVLKRGDPGAKSYAIDAKLYDTADLEMVVDGWAAPMTAGNFVDLIEKGYYNGMTIQRADGFIIQTGDNGDKGYRPVEGGKVRRVPLEVAVKGRPEALYGETLDEANLVRTEVRIPFQADGTLAMARNDNDNDSASAQIFWFLFESDMTPAGKNFLDGRYSTFGYTVKGQEFCRQIREGDVIESIKVLSGLENFEKRAA